MKILTEAEPSNGEEKGARILQVGELEGRLWTWARILVYFSCKDWKVKCRRFEVRQTVSIPSSGEKLPH
jgi:hypothetical protein